MCKLETKRVTSAGPQPTDVFWTMLGFFFVELFELELK